MRRLLGGTAFVMAMVAAGWASAAGIGQAEPWQMGFQGAVTPIMERIDSLHTFLLWVIVVISLFVMGLLIYAMIKFNSRANPEPSRTTHNTFIEILWTVVPILILLVIAVPSFRLLYFQRDFPQIDMTIKAIGNQWYWSYEYPDNGDISFDSIMLEGEELEERRKVDPGAPRLLAVDNEVIVPAGKTVRVIVTASDVLHNFAMPSFGNKMDAVPGRLNETWFKVDREGVYYGQCSELCGIKHAFMPIAIRVVSQEKFDAWAMAAADDIDEAQQQILAEIANERKLAESKGSLKVASTAADENSSAEDKN
ncbi:MAG: cytochrome c oxidase subunit II [Hyphomicrobiales bacterium]